MMKGMVLRPGDVCAFRTSPICSSSQPDTGRYAVLKVLTVGEKVVYAVLDGIFTERPNLGHITNLAVLRNNRFTFDGTPALHATSPNWDVDLLDFTVIGNVAASSVELELIPRWPSFGTWHTASKDAEGEWRWRHDQEAFKQEVRLDHDARAASRRAEQERYNNRLKHLTWEGLAAETLFVRWSPSPPYPPVSFTEALRLMFCDAMVKLRGLGLKPPKRSVRSILHGLIDQINELDVAHGQVIETEEREDVCCALSELAFLARHPALMEDVDSWRTW